MTREEAKEYAKEMTYRDAVCNALQGRCIPYRKATLIKLYELLDRLEQEPCGEAISREDALMCLTGEWTEITDEIIHRFIKRIKALPPVNPQPYEDAISREATLKPYNGLNDEDTISVWLIRKNIEQQPPVNPQPKWIPVSERLPEEEQEILFSTKTGRVHSGKYYDDGSANQWYSHKDKCRAWNNVVNAWMPLPAPFESYESEDKG